MKSILLIGLGRFGRHIAQELNELGHQVMAIDSNEAVSYTHLDVYKRQEKDSAINDEIDRLRHSATAALSERRDVIIVASVSCI